MANDGVSSPTSNPGVAVAAARAREPLLPRQLSDGELALFVGAGQRRLCVRAS